MSDTQHHQLRTNRAAGPAGLHVEHSVAGAPFVRLTAANGRILAHSQGYSEDHEASQAVDTMERVTVEQSHPAGAALYAVLRRLDQEDAGEDMAEVVDLARSWAGTPAGLRDELVSLAAAAVLAVHHLDEADRGELS